MKIRYWHVDAFAQRPFEGNQAAVMELDHWLPDATLQAIGAENNFAETAFIVPLDDGNGWALRWFTPLVEVRLCGHATLAAGHAILDQEPGRRSVRFETRHAGTLEVRRAGNGYEIALPAISSEPVEWLEAIAAMGANPLELWRNPHGYTIMLYAEADQVRALKPDFSALAQLGTDSFTATAPAEDTDIISRVFVPGAGVDEDSVTGSAHAALTPFWARRLGRDQFTAFQASSRGGHLICRLDGDTAWLGGGCVTIVKGIFHL